MYPYNCAVHQDNTTINPQIMLNSMIRAIAPSKDVNLLRKEIRKARKFFADHGIETYTAPDGDLFVLEQDFLPNLDGEPQCIETWVNASNWSPRDCMRFAGYCDGMIDRYQID